MAGSRRRQLRLQDLVWVAAAVVLANRCRSLRALDASAIIVEGARCRSRILVGGR